jgi:hypothetical protein
MCEYKVLKFFGINVTDNLISMKAFAPLDLYQLLILFLLVGSMTWLRLHMVKHHLITRTAFKLTTQKFFLLCQSYEKRLWKNKGCWINNIWNLVC